MSTATRSLPHARYEAQSDLASTCPRYSGCSASYCPAIGGKYVKDDATCFWLREAVKTDGRLKIRGSLREDLAEAVLRAASHLLEQRTTLGKALRKAAEAASKVDAGRRLQDRVAHPLPRASVHP